MNTLTSRAIAAIRARGVLPVVMTLAALVALAFAVNANIEQHQETDRRLRYEKCQADVYDAVIASLRDTRAAAAEERTANKAENDALQEAMEQIRDNPRGFASSIDKYLAAATAADVTRAEAEKTRTAAPLPEPPKVACAADALIEED